MVDQTHHALIENEAYFRHHNERIRHNFEAILKLAKESNQEYLIREDDTELHFHCECSDENCKKRIMLKPSVYNKIHKNRRQFVILNGHETSAVEKVITHTHGYAVVEKLFDIRVDEPKLNQTDVNNV